MSIESLKALAKAATPGAWEKYSPSNGKRTYVIASKGREYLFQQQREVEPNADYVVAACNALPKLIACVEAAKAMRRHAPTIKQQQDFDAALAALEE